MTYKRTWLSCLLWAAFSCITGIMLANYSIFIWKMRISAATGYGTIVFVFFIFSTVTGCFFFFRKVLAVQIQKIKNSEHASFLWEIIIVPCLFTAGFLYRAYLFLQYDARQMEVTQYYHDATVKAAEKMEPMVHGISHIYTVCLSFIFSFLGNKIMAAVWIQVFIQLFTILLAYIIVRKLVGKLPACVMLYILAFSSIYAKRIFQITPENLYFLFYLLGLYIIGSYVKAYCQMELGRIAALMGALCSGIVIGILIYLDLLSLTLLLFPIGLITGICKAETNVEDDKLEGTKTSFTVTNGMLLFLLVVLSAAFTLFGMFVLDAQISKTNINSVGAAWFDLYKTSLSVNYILYESEVPLIECFVVVLLTALLIPAFWNRKKIQNAATWFGLMLLLAPTPLTAVGVLPYQVYSVFIWSVLAGIGLQQSIVPEAVIETETIIGNKSVIDTRTVIEPKSVVDTGTVIEPKTMIATETAETARFRKESKVPVIEAGKSQVRTEPVAGEREAMKKKEKPRFIENPLPLPKKHVKKEMDYQYQVPEEKMSYDINTRELDDYDIP